MAEILEMLQDGKWHSLEDIQCQTEIDDTQIMRITDFLKDYNFVVTDMKKKKIKLNRNVQRFLTQTVTS
jgi:DNA-binding IclR family transcriptional regulator